MIKRFDAKHKGDLVQRADVTMLGKGSVLALTTRACESLEDLHHQLKQGAATYHTLGEHHHEDGTHTLVLRSPQPAEAVARSLTQMAGKDAYREVVKEKSWTESVDLMRVRGVLGNIGQAMVFYSGLKRGLNFDKPAKADLFSLVKVKDPYVEVYSAGTSIAANMINLGYGVQKRGDEAGLYLTKQRINEALGTHAISAQERQVEENIGSSTLDQIDHSLKKNSTVASDLLKFFGKMILSKSSSDVWLQRAGKLSQFAKIVTLAGKGKETEPQRQLDEQPEADQAAVLDWVEYAIRDVFGKEVAKKYIDPVRRQAMPVSGLSEFAATGFIMNSGLKDLYEATAASDEKLINANKFKVGGTAIIMLGLLCKAAAPFSEKKIDRGELFAHIDAALDVLPQGHREEHVPEIIDAMREIPEFGEASYAELYAELTAHRMMKAAEQAPANMNAAPSTKVHEAGLQSMSLPRQANSSERVQAIHSQNASRHFMKSYMSADIYDCGSPLSRG